MSLIVLLIRLVLEAFKPEIQRLLRKLAGKVMLVAKRRPLE
jgi:hypothetical protein